MPFIRESWYPASWAEALGPDPLARTFLGEEVVLYRSESGAPVALSNMCPHRFAALAKGKRHGDSIACPYHGLRFGPDGQCTHNPHGPATGAMRVRVWPLVERHGMVWIWMGDPANADPARVPVLATREDARFDWVLGYLHVEGNYQLVIDNLLDLTHVEFLHPFLADPTDTFPTEVTCSEQGDEVVSCYTRPQCNRTQLVSALWDDAPEVISLISEMRWSAPSNLIQRNGFDVPFHPDMNDTRVQVPFCHLLTPETEFTTHYFWAGGRNAKQGEDAVSQAFRFGVEGAFKGEDEPMIADIQQRMGTRDLFAMKPLLLPIDKSAVLARRRVTALLQQEEGA
ncbi:MAG: Vanillate O-demethylase oxygenase subunit [Pseudomonadota bacterium]|jgi:vanillate O-demethylase monooxygenase subunit